MTHRSAFTLLELTVASFLGTAVLIATIGVFASIARADRRTAARFDRSTQLALLQRSVQRAWDSVVMADGGATEALDPEAAEPPDPAPPEPLPPLRILLEPDPALSGLTMSRRTPTERGWAAGESILPQRLELALSAPPATQGARDYRRTLRLQEQGLLPVETGPEVAADRSVRGAFEFRPEGRTTAFGEAIYSLWWRPMAQAETAEELAEAPRPIDVATAEGAVELVEEVIWARWRVFKRREWRETYRAITVPDLPAYAELEITTPEMMTANWIFEVAWTIGDDPSAPETGEGGEGGEGGEDEDGGGAQTRGGAALGTLGTSTTESDGTTTVIDESGVRRGTTSTRRDRR
jgi:hypothetical protein